MRIHPEFCILLFFTVTRRTRCNLLSRVKNLNVYLPREDLEISDTFDRDVNTSVQGKTTPVEDPYDDYDVDKDPDPGEARGIDAIPDAEGYTYRPTQSKQTYTASKSSEQVSYEYMDETGWPTFTIKLPVKMTVGQENLRYTVTSPKLSLKRRLFPDESKRLPWRKTTSLAPASRYGGSVETSSYAIVPLHQTALSDLDVIRSRPLIDIVSDFAALFTRENPPFTRTVSAASFNDLIPSSILTPPTIKWRPSPTHDDVSTESAHSESGSAMWPYSVKHRVINRIPDSRDDPSKLFRRGKRSRNNECYECGLTDEKFGSPRCHTIFESADQRHRHQRMAKRECTGNRSYIGGCFMRYLDVGVVYNERGCRAWPPVRGKSYASNRFMHLERMLRYQEEGCVVTPHAVLVPFSEAVQLYARFHVCVCKGSYCNTATSRHRHVEATLLALIVSKVT